MSQAAPNGVNNAVTANPEKKTEESGGIFGGIFDSKPDEAAGAGAGAGTGTGAGATASVPVSQPEGSNVGAEKESGGLFSGLLGSNDEEDKAKTTENGVAKEEEKPGFFAKLLKGENAPEAEAVAKVGEKDEEEAEVVATAATSGTEAGEEKKTDVPLLDRMKGIFASPSDEKKDGNLDNISESEDEKDGSDDDGSDDDGSDDEVELFLTKIKTLRSKCRKMKMKYRTLKGKYDEMKTKGSANGDNSDFTKVVASILAMEGLVKQNKLYIKEYAKKNNIQIEGFGLGDDEDERSESEGEGEKLPKIEETLEETNETNEQPLSGSRSESESGSESESSSGSGSGSESEEEGVEVSNPLEPVSVNSNESLPVSMGEDGTVNPEPTVPAVPAPAPAPAQTAPAPAAPAPPSGQISGEIAKILGGRSHFVKKNHIKTYRHHNRRSRHKTLKNKA